MMSRHNNACTYMYFVSFMLCLGFVGCLVAQIVLSPEQLVAATLRTQNPQLLSLADHRPVAYITTVCDSSCTLDVQSSAVNAGTVASLAGGSMRAFDDDQRFDRMQQGALETAHTNQPHTSPQHAVITCMVLF